jgi:hypothetical protein
MKLVTQSACVAAALLIVLLAAAPDSSDARRKGCKVPARAAVVERITGAIAFSQKFGSPSGRTTVFYGCARDVGRKVRLWRCNPGQLTSDRFQSVRLTRRVAILEIERMTQESNPSWFHVTRRVSLRTGKWTDVRSEPRPLPPGGPLIFEC